MCVLGGLAVKCTLHSLPYNDDGREMEILVEEWLHWGVPA